MRFLLAESAMGGSSPVMNIDPNISREINDYTHLKFYTLSRDSFLIQLAWLSCVVFY
ncbi:hypothetical protein PALI_a0259 [Pseudoalteromonas aliena SW19]|uniref:Uncharacterized protein n=1 Tax=Pseudoalteromonas aliena SW19 TaxID=1314866 RepID=A0ABR9DZK5_9GAMM|nr:hypothetical protein [Pseudoalteromonas aliena SW19]